MRYICSSAPLRSLSLAVGLLLLTGCLLPSLPPAPAPTREGRWQQDIRYCAENLKRLHLDPFRFAAREKFDAAAEELAASAGRRSDPELIVGLAQLVAQLGDAHTKVGLGSRRDFHWYPVSFTQFSDGVYVTSVTKGLEDLLGARLVGIEGHSLDEARAALTTVISHENDAALNIWIPRYLRSGEILQVLGLAAAGDQARFRFENEAGAEFDRPLLAQLTADSQTWITLHAHRGVDLPLYLQNQAQNYWYQYLADSRTLYCAYNACAETKGRSFGQFTHEVLALLDHHPIERFVLDLRNNGGGNSMVAWPLLWGLQWRTKVNRPGHLFALLGNRTFSSAALNALDLQRSTAVVLVGQPTGQKPNSFGELKWFTLPNSKLIVTYSTKFFRVYRDQDPPSYLPDLEVETSFADYAAGRDPVLEAVLAHPQ